MKIRFLILSAALIMSVDVYSQVRDSIYSMPSLPGFYAAHLSKGDMRRLYLFSTEGEWYRYEGSQVNDSTEVAITNTEINEGLVISNSSTGFDALTSYCTPSNHEGCADLDLTEITTGVDALLSTGQLKAIFKTQWGAELIAFDADGVAVLLVFEKEIGDDPYTATAAYTGVLGEDFSMTDIKPVMQSDPSDSAGIRFDLKISDLENPQAEFRNVTCANVDEETCQNFIDNYFSHVTRIF